MKDRARLGQWRCEDRTPPSSGIRGGAPPPPRLRREVRHHVAMVSSCSETRQQLFDDWRTTRGIGSPFRRRPGRSISAPRSRPWEGRSVRVAAGGVGETPGGRWSLDIRRRKSDQPTFAASGSEPRGATGGLRSPPSHGTENQNRAPPPGRLAAPNSPPCTRTARATVASPSPDPAP
jgi:hypothetical protein